ncbi:uncharacterized protein LOC135681054 [Rhopilema esculentum]|uniref:uncharacterized protein LOC135681054 n=1 Tax=Rhopilema esculentum TaxID=499914 RepID=UPI0031DAC841
MSKNIDGKDITTAFRKRQQILKKTMASLDSSRYSNLSLREALTLNGWTNRTAIDNLVEYVVIDDMEGVPPELLSVSHFVKQSGINTKLGRQFFITEQNGYKKLIDGLEELALQGDSTKLKLDHEVKKIHWNKYGVRVETSNGKVFTAKVLISTASNGVYHNSPHLFYPKLPKWKQDALWKFKMATYTKIFLKFPYRFWDNVEYIFYAAEKRGTFPVWQSLDAGNRYNKNTNMLLLPVTGQESYRVEQMKENDLIKEIMSQVMSVYGPNVPWPTDIVVPKWSSKEHFYGSFTYLPAFTSHADFVALRANVGPIFFAGEATHEVHQSYIHGAYFEGINRACDAIQALRGFLDVSSGQFDYNYYDSCLRDSCNCCSK